MEFETLRQLLTRDDQTLLKEIPKGTKTGLIKAPITYYTSGSAIQPFLHLVMGDTHHTLTSNHPFLEDDLLISREIILSSEKFLTQGLSRSIESLPFKHLLNYTQKTLPFSRLSDKEILRKELDIFFEDLLPKGTTLPKAHLIFDEFFTNAFYNATIYKERENEIVDRLNHADIHYPDGLSGHLILGRYDKYISIECIDPYGSLHPMTLARSIKHSLGITLSDLINSKEGGAGIGLRLVYDASISLYAIVNEHKMTSITAFIPYGVSNKKLDSFTKNFHILFSKEESMSDFRYTEQKTGTKTILKLEGSINEDAILKNITFSSNMNLELDFAKVDGINSCGIREWIKWESTFPTDGKMNWINCPQEIIDQVNMVAGFLPPNAFVESFYIPYFCESCENTTNVLIKRTQGDKKLPDYEEEIKCAHCEAQAEIDIIENKYFKFIEK